MADASGEQEQAGLLERTAQVLFRMRRRIATGAVIAAALVFGYHAIFGENGLNVYEQKENTRLRQQVQALKTDPDAIEHEARSRLHYARPGEVIWTEDAPPSSPNLAQPAKK